MSASQPILWGRVVALAVATEATMIAASVGMQAAGTGQDPVTVMALVGSFALPLLFARMLGRRLSSRFVLHGFLIGFVAMLVFLALSEAARRWGPPQPPQPFAYTVAHVLKLLGGALGGVLAQRRSVSRPAAVTTSRT